MTSKQILLIIGGALFAALVYWLRAEFNISFSKYSSGDPKDIDFSWGMCLLWAVFGGAIGAFSIFRGKKN